MNPFVFACITPHGSEIIEELSHQNPDLMSVTRGSMEQLGRYMVEAGPETIIVLTPHGVRIDGQFCVADCERIYGEVEDNGGKVTMERAVDRELAKAIVQEAKQGGLPVGAVNFATAAGPYSCLPMDWGVLVPLWFMPEVPVVVVTPTRTVGFAEHVRLGEAVARAVAASGKRVGLIASCDWSHAHDENGPYGFDPAAAKLDAEVVELLKENQIERMAEFAPEFIEAAKPDGIWQALVLGGGIPSADRDVEFLSYEVPTYFGLMCAAYHRK
ncbi:extradiol ring-cleavage dioxygenase [Tumebacillus avium]|uniref:Extradiol ring-cleavage dioxygenase n=1 Tax=Tumebacillus avium TaxID=1903704 RepID=A0A1Y0IL42_9BACL|nr:extradiol ring-cleavage dioxygenase [Tumebacillus avium]ARU61221.1 extradiol ring-cleavage dioxygenase [Tumebacillus avium]